MASPIIELRSAEHMVLRLLIGGLWERLLLAEDDPMAAFKEVSERQLGALEKVAEVGPGSEFFRQSALHEMETFWNGVGMTIKKTVDARNRSGK